MILVFDDVVPDPDAYRAVALAQPFRSLEVAPGVIFHGIAMVTDQVLVEWMAHRFPQLTPTLTFFRQSPAGQVEPNYIHTDRDMGDWTAILYLNPDTPKGDGTVFWRHRVTGATESVTDDAHALAVEQAAWRDRTLWEPAVEVEARFNRVLVFSAAQFHSRAIPNNYGVGEDARLIQVVFGSGALELQEPTWPSQQAQH
jgi:Family of unknown function (DUF6445)